MQTKKSLTEKNDVQTKNVLRISKTSWAKQSSFCSNATINKSELFKRISRLTWNVFILKILHFSILFILANESAILICNKSEKFSQPPVNLFHIKSSHKCNKPWWKSKLSLRIFLMHVAKWIIFSLFFNLENNALAMFFILWSSNSKLYTNSKWENHDEKVSS